MYSPSSPYYKTPFVSGQYLDVLKIRPIPAEPDDVLYIIQVQYTHRPDLLAFDMYGDKDLWWVYAQRNLEILKDPINDFKPGLVITAPSMATIEKLSRG